MSDDYETDFGSDDKRDWPDDNSDDKNNEASENAQNSSQIANTNHNLSQTQYLTHQNEEAKSQ